MIKLTSFYPFSNFMRITQEFHEDKAVVKWSSLKAEREYTFNYNKITRISYSKEASESQMFFGLSLALLSIIVVVLFSSQIHANPLALRSVRVLFLLTVSIFVTGLIHHKYYYFYDKDGNHITFIKATRNNHGSIEKAINLTKSASPKIKETTPLKPFLDINPIFEMTYYDTPYYLNIITVKFSEDMLIAHHKSVIGESAQIVEYNSLSGEVMRGKESNSSWATAYYFILVLSTFTAGLYSLFDILPRQFFLYTEYILGILLVIFILLRYIKKEVIGLYDKNENIVYWTWVNKSNKEKIEEIIRYVQSRIPAENKEEVPKE